MIDKGIETYNLPLLKIVLVFKEIRTGNHYICTAKFTSKDDPNMNFYYTFYILYTMSFRIKGIALIHIMETLIKYRYRLEIVLHDYKLNLKDFDECITCSDVKKKFSYIDCLSLDNPNSDVYARLFKCFYQHDIESYIKRRYSISGEDTITDSYYEEIVNLHEYLSTFYNSTDCKIHTIIDEYYIRKGSRRG